MKKKGFHGILYASSGRVNTRPSQNKHYKPAHEVAGRNKQHQRGKPNAMSQYGVQCATFVVAKMSSSGAKLLSLIIVIKKIKLLKR